MAKTIQMIGIYEQELPWLRLLTSLLRHADPLVPEFARQSLLYVAENANARDAGKPDAQPLAQTLEPSLGMLFSGDTDFPPADSMPSVIVRAWPDRSQAQTSVSSGFSKL